MWLRIQSISVGLTPVLSHTEKLYIASYYRQFSMNFPLVANKTGFNIIVFNFTICRKLKNNFCSMTTNSHDSLYVCLLKSCKRLEHFKEKFSPGASSCQLGGGVRKIPKFRVLKKKNLGRGRNIPLLLEAMEEAINSLIKCNCH